MANLIDTRWAQRHRRKLSANTPPSPGASSEDDKTDNALPRSPNIASSGPPIEGGSAASDGNERGFSLTAYMRNKFLRRQQNTDRKWGESKSFGQELLVPPIDSRRSSSGSTSSSYDNADPLPRSPRSSNLPRRDIHYDSDTSTAYKQRPDTRSPSWTASVDSQTPNTMKRVSPALEKWDSSQEDLDQSLAKARRLRTLARQRMTELGSLIGSSSSTDNVQRSPVQDERNMAPSADKRNSLDSQYSSVASTTRPLYRDRGSYTELPSRSPTGLNRFDFGYGSPYAGEHRLPYQPHARSPTGYAPPPGLLQRKSALATSPLSLSEDRIEKYKEERRKELSRKYGGIALSQRSKTIPAASPNVGSLQTSEERDDTPQSPPASLLVHQPSLEPSSPVEADYKLNIDRLDLSALADLPSDQRKAVIKAHADGLRQKIAEKRKHLLSMRKMGQSVDVADSPSFDTGILPVGTANRSSRQINNGNGPKSPGSSLAVGFTAHSDSQTQTH